MEEQTLRKFWRRQARSRTATLEVGKRHGRSRRVELKRWRKKQDAKSARQAYLRASNYTRASGYMLVGDGPDQPDGELVHVVEKVSALFRKAIALSDQTVHFLDIPYGNGPPLPVSCLLSVVDKSSLTVTQATLYLPPPCRRLPGKIPILISNGGADALQEELYYMHPSLGPDLGYAVLTFEGPGQGVVLRKHNLKMRADWEVVIKHVIDKD